MFMSVHYAKSQQLEHRLYIRGYEGHKVKRTPLYSGPFAIPQFPPQV